MLDMFKTDAFGIVRLTEAINKAPHQPMQIGSSGLFREKGITETKVGIELKDGQLVLVQSKPRGGPGDPIPKNRRGLIALSVPHLPVIDGLEADEVQDVRAFGSEDQSQVVSDVVNEKLETMRASLDVTIEHMRAGAIQGVVKDADLVTILNLFDAFEVEQSVATLSPDSASDGGDYLRRQITAIQRQIETVLGAAPITGFRAYCGSQIFDAIRADVGVVQTLRYADPQALLQQEAGIRRFIFGGVVWEEYRGSVGGEPFFADDEAYVFPLGPSIFRTWFAPANYMETVNTIGLPFYAKQELRKFDKGVDIEAQSNPLSICTRPDAVVKVTLAT